MFIYSLNIIHLFLLSLDLSIVDILIVRHKLIDSSTWSQLNDAVSNCANKLMVVRSKQDITLKLYKVVVECLD